MKAILPNEIVKNFLPLVLLSFCAICLFSFSVASDAVGVFDLKRIFICVVVIANCLLLILSSSLKKQFLFRTKSIEKKTALLLTVFLFFVIISNTFFSLYFVRAQLDFFYLLGLALLTTTISTGTICDRQVIYRYFSAITTVLFLSVMAGHWVHSSVETVPHIRSILNFANPRYINQIQIWLIVPALYLVLISYKRRGLKGSLLPLLIASLHVAMGLALDARGFFLVSATSVLIWLFIDKTNRAALVKLLGLVFIAGMAIKYLLLTPFPFYLFNGYLPDSVYELRTTSSNRITVWKDLLGMASFWGHGGDAYVCNSHPTVAGPHNSLLLYLFNWGVVPALSYTLLVALLFFKVITTKMPSVRVAGLSVLAGLGYSLITGTLDLPLSQLMAVISLALFWYKSAPKAPSTSAPPNAIDSASAKVLIILSLLVITTVSYRVYDRVSHNHYRHLLVEDEKPRPQFWMENSCPDEESYLRKF
ncbi:hypothetical protein L3Q72_11535 [Vibrio sp. JC009]|uniref:O-antigen ligase family protein n=1 Tax=Vibrio sp. JC009 TaxID=2912314 RepID=UPI0023B1A2FC|nr:hypothetical protein [Vibrio sp. JC009]WED21268.1 hypothetical protein L3Q72_11535 [Vibrio sp. JC009]